MNTIRNSFLFLFALLCFSMLICANVSAQEAIDPKDVVVVGGGGFAIEDEKIFNGAGMDDFGTVYSASGDFHITLNDVYLTNNTAVITLTLGTTRSANNHVSSSAVYINGEQKLGGGSVGEAIGEPFEQTITFFFYGGIPDAAPGSNWDNLKISFNDLIFALYGPDDSGYLGTPEGYDWSIVFHNPEISRYDHDDLAPTVDERGTHTYDDHAEITLSSFSAGQELNFDLIRKSSLLNYYASQEALWVNDQQRGGGGSSVSFDENGEPEISGDEQFTQTDHFLYQWEKPFDPESFAVWARSVTFELTAKGNPSIWTGSLSEELFPMKLVHFVLSN